MLPFKPEISHMLPFAVTKLQSTPAICHIASYGFAAILIKLFRQSSVVLLQSVYSSLQLLL